MSDNKPYNSLNCEPSSDYETLRKQFLAMRQLAKSLEGQNSYLRNHDNKLTREALLVNAANVSAERDTNAMLTESLLSAEAQRDCLLSALEGVLAIVNESLGVAGFHLNGAIAEWDEFEEISEAIEAVSFAKQGVTK